MVCGLMVPTANGSRWRGSEYHPAGRCPVRRVRLAVVASRRSLLLVCPSWLTSSCLKPCAATSWPCSRIACTVAG